LTDPALARGGAGSASLIDHVDCAAPGRGHAGPPCSRSMPWFSNL